MLQSKIIPDYSPRPDWNFSTKTNPAPKHKPVVYEYAKPGQEPKRPQQPPVPPPKPIQIIAPPAPKPIPKLRALFSAPTSTQTLQPDASFSANIETFASNGVPYFKLASDNSNNLSQWATFPAVADVNMNNFDLNNVSTITTTNSGSVNTPFVTLRRQTDGTQGKIQMFDNTNTPHILESIGGDLFFDTELLAKANDIQNIADWSLYPALSTINVATNNITGAQKIQTVQLTNASGTFGTSGQYLTSDGTTINWITPAAPPDNTSNWATFPAVANVNMGLSSITSTATMTFEIPGSSTTLSAGAGGTLLVNGSPVTPGPGNASQWATFPAVANVSVPDFDFTLTSVVPNPNIITPYKTATIKGNLTVGDTAQAGVRPDFNAYVGSFNVGGGGSPATAISLNSVGTLTLASLANLSLTSATTTITSGLVSVVGVGGVAITGGGDVAVTGGAVNVTGTVGVAVTGGGGVAVSGGGAVTVTGGVGVSVLGGGGVAVTGGGGVSVVGGAGVLIDSNGSLKTDIITNVTGTGNTLAINNVSTINGAVYPPPGSGGVSSLNTETGAVTITSPTANLVVGSTGAGNIELTVPGGALSSFLSLYSIYVAPNGNDTTGTGSANNPYLTIGRAITARALISATQEVAIQLFPGTYTPAGGGIVLTRNTWLVGIPTGEVNQPVNINAQVSLQGTVGAGQIGLFGLNLFPASSQCVIINTVGTYNISNCNIFNNGNNYAIAQSLGTLFLSECRITSPTTGTFPGIGVTGNTASIIMRDCLMTSSGTPSMITCIGSLAMRQCVLTNTSTDATVNPLVNYNPTAAGNSCEISYCTLQYTSAVAATNKICVRANPTAGITATIINFVFNLLLCEGAQSGTSPNNFHCIDRVSAGGPVTLSYGNLLAGATAHQIDSTITKTQYQTVP